jgi:hypothetical protein
MFEGNDLISKHWVCRCKISTVITETLTVWTGSTVQNWVRPMKIDIMFLVPARMGFICRMKIFHYSLFLKNRLNKTPNWSPDQSLNYCCIPQAQLKLYLSKDITRQNASIIHVSPGIYKLKWIIHRFTSDFYHMGFFTGSRKLLTSRIQTRKKMKKSRSKFLKIDINCDMKHDINFHWPK